MKMNLYEMQDTVMEFMKENWSEMTENDRKMLKDLHHQIRCVDTSLNIKHI